MVGPCVRMYRCALDGISMVLVVAIARVDLVRRSIVSLFFLFWSISSLLYGGLEECDVRL